MGFFSWKTQDTNKSIPSSHSCRPTFPVTLTDNKGGRWHEPNYDGYGVFDGKDYYVLVAEMNGKATGDMQETRVAGIQLELGISALRHTETGKIYKSGGIDFFHWSSEILPHGLSANASLELDEWEHITIKEEGVVLPNLTEDPNHTWIDEGAEHCPDQGFFYDDASYELN
jgi:hypothetical protein